MAKRVWQIARHCAKLKSLQIRALRRRMPLVRLWPVRAQAVDDLKEKWRRRAASNKCAVGAAVEIADPNRKHVMIENADGPGVTKSVRRSRFPVNRGGICGVGAIHFRPRHVAEHLQSEEGSFGRKNSEASC